MSAARSPTSPPDRPDLRIATAGWSIPRAVAEAFPAEGSGLSRYASRFNAVEINTTFYRPHRQATYARWREATPPDFRFAVKLPKVITHVARLADADHLIATFRQEAAVLGDKLGALLVQLPPSLAFSAPVAEWFFSALRKQWPQAIVCEPRHTTWFEDSAEALLVAYQIARVAADPAPYPAAAEPGGWPGLAYWRLHGSPHMYYSPYPDAYLTALKLKLDTAPPRPTWCVFDNTAAGAAAADALRFQAIMQGRGE